MCGISEWMSVQAWPSFHDFAWAHTTLRPLLESKASLMETVQPNYVVVRAGEALALMSNAHTSFHLRDKMNGPSLNWLISQPLLFLPGSNLV